MKEGFINGYHVKQVKLSSIRPGQVFYLSRSARAKEYKKTGCNLQKKDGEMICNISADGFFGYGRCESLVFVKSK